jgi:flagellar basal body rod protein FlgG
LSSDGAQIAVDPRLPWEMSESGAVQQAGLLQPLALVKPQSLGDLVRVGENLFASLADVSPLPVAERHVLSGYLEQSTVKPALEMMDLIETSRAYENNIRMIQHQDQMLGSLVNRVLRPT